jgi:hypothetical protein
MAKRAGIPMALAAIEDLHIDPEKANPMVV